MESKHLHGSLKNCLTILLLAASVLMTGCASTTYTVDDGSPVDEKLLSDIRTFGKGHRAIRPQIVKSAQLNDKECSKQYELPFFAYSSYDLPKEKKIAWVRGLGVDERLTVIAATPESGLVPGDHIEKINGYSRENIEKMTNKLIDLRDDGDAFTIEIAGGNKVTVKPIEVCRGRVNINPPESEEPQSYHWLQSTHPLQVFTQDLTSDEAAWLVLWTQGLSEEAGARMKTYHYGLKAIKAGITIASIASGVGAVANAAQAAATQAAASQAAQQAGKAAAQAATEAAAKAAAEAALEQAKQKLIDKIQAAIINEAQEVAITSIAAATVFRESLSGISWVAGTGFYMADKWALERMERLGYDLSAAYSLHYKLASNALFQNGLIFDEERLGLMKEHAKRLGFEEKALYALGGPTRGIDLVPIVQTVALPPLEIDTKTAIRTNVKLTEALAVKCEDGKLCPSQNIFTPMSTDTKAEALKQLASVTNGEEIKSSASSAALLVDDKSLEALK